MLYNLCLIEQPTLLIANEIICSQGLRCVRGVSKWSCCPLSISGLVVWQLQFSDTGVSGGISPTYNIAQRSHSVCNLYMVEGTLVLDQQTFTFSPYSSPNNHWSLFPWLHVANSTTIITVLAVFMHAVHLACRCFIMKSKPMIMS